MAEPRGRKNPRVRTAEVMRTERLTPHMVRVVLGGPGLEGFDVGECTDHYLKLLFPAAGATYPEPFDLQRIRAELPREAWPRTRTYTVRRWDPAERELWVDFVLHGGEGLAGPWAAAAKPGDVLRFTGPGGAYAPDPEAEWHLLLGDEAALPAIAATLEQLPVGARARVLIEVAGPEEEHKLDSPADVDLRWLHRGAARVGERLLRAARALDLSGDVHAFVHGEAGFVKELRRLLAKERALPKERLSISGYWRLGQDEDRWQATKREFDPTH
ncbi:siderophore-interacting protein [Glycomyces tarimensis]